MTTIERIETILKDQVKGYRALRDLLQKERESLIHLDSRAVEALSKEKDTVVLKLRLLEEERLRLMQAHSRETAAPFDTSLQKLAELTGHRAFLDLRLQMISLLQGISELNEFNRILIERSAGVVRNALQYLGTFTTATVSARATGAVFSREA